LLLVPWCNVNKSRGMGSIKYFLSRNEMKWWLVQQTVPVRPSPFHRPWQLYAACSCLRRNDHLNSMHAGVSFNSERLCTKQPCWNKTQRLLLPQSSLCWPLLGAASCKGFALLRVFSLSRRRKCIYCYARRRKSKKRCGHGRGHEGSGDPRPARLWWRIGSTHLIGAEGCMPWHGNADAMPSRQACTLVYLW
jgi:hypothetical protein